MRRLMQCSAVLLLSAAAGGCGSKDGPVSVYPVTGQVIYDGKPAAGVEVVFFPTTAPTRPVIPNSPHAVTDADGRFTLGTYDTADGAPEGGYMVILTWPQKSSEEDESPPDRLFEWYGIRNTKLTYDVKAGDNTIPPYKLPAVYGPPPVSEGIPGRN